jgi:hypothetical protein
LCQCKLRKNENIQQFFEEEKEMKKYSQVIGLYFYFLLTQISFAEMQWVPTTPLSRPRTNPGVTVGTDGLIYAVGGVDQGYGSEHATNTAERFDENTKTWTSIASMNEKRHGTGAATDYHGYIYAVGGHYLGDTGNVVLSSVERYNPLSNSWSLLPQEFNMNNPRSHHGIAILPDDSIFVFGGFNLEGSQGDNILSSVEKRDPVTGIWSFVSPMNEARSNVAYAVDQQNRIYAIGGQTKYTYLDTVERYDPGLDIWEYVASLPDTLSQPTTFTLNNEIYAVGGWNGSYTSACYIYSPDANNWRPGPSMYEEMGLARAAVGFSGTPYLIGGEGPAIEARDRVAMLVPEPNPIQEILGFIEKSVADGTLVPVKDGKAGHGQLGALTNMIETAGNLIDANDPNVCGQLHAALGKTDGNEPPPDFVTGPAAPQLAVMIEELMDSLGCE